MCVGGEALKSLVYLWVVKFDTKFQKLAQYHDKCNDC